MAVHPVERIEVMSDDVFICPDCAREYAPAEVERGGALCRRDGAALLQLSAALRPGTVLDGRYTLLRPLGSGGMGVVFRARQHATGAELALKVINARMTDPGLVRRLMREARASAAIGHANVVRVLDHGQTREGIAFLAMELLEGDTLEQLMRSAGPLDAGRAAFVATCVAEALEASHALGILHRDLKPSNIFVTRDADGTRLVKVLDFGLAKAIGGDEGELLTRTGTGAMMGTPTYMSPEQYVGDSLGPHSDLYALGGVFFEMLTGQPPFVETSLFELMRAHIEQPAVAPSSLLAPGTVPDALDTLCLELLAKERTRRPQAAAEVVARLRPFCVPLSEPGSGAPDHASLDAAAVRIGALRSGDHDAVAADTMHTVPGAASSVALQALLFRPGLTGRERERERLEAVLDAVLATRQPALLALEGPGGVGKSRLLEWLAADARRRRARVVIGYHRADGAGALGALADALEQLYGTRGLDADALDARLQRLAERETFARDETLVSDEYDVADLLAEELAAAEARAAGTPPTTTTQREALGDFERRLVVDFLRPRASESGAHGGVAALALAERHELLYGALARALVLGARATATLVVLDDLRASEPLDEAFVLRLAQTLAEADAALLVLLAVRSDGEPGGGRTASLDRALRSALDERWQRVRLGALEGEALGRLVEGALPGADPALVAYVAAMSGGNPLYALQLLRHLVGEGVLVRERARWLLRGEPSLPEDLAGLLDARLSRLSQANAAAQSVLMRAALLGTRVPVALLEAMLEHEGAGELAGALEGLLDKLVGEGWLRDEESWEADVVVFEHGFVREALVRRLGTRRAARRLHGFAAEALEGFYAGALEAHALAIAGHWSASGSAERALPHAMTAARAAARRHALDEAARAWQLAASLCELGSGAAQDGDGAAKQRSEPGAVAERGHARASELWLDPGTRANIARGLAGTLLALGRYEEAEAVLGEAGEAAATLELRGDLADARSAFEQAVVCYEAAVAGFEAEGRPLEAAGARVKHALVVSKRGEDHLALALAEPAVALAREQDAVELEATAANALAMFAQRLGDAVQAGHWLDREEVLRRNVADPVARGRCAYTRGTLLWRQGQHQRALEHFGEAIRMLREVGHRRGLANSLKMAAACEVDLGRPGDAEHYLRQTWPIFESLGDTRGLVGTAQGMADACSSRGDHEAAIEWAQRALELAESLGSNRDRHLALLTLGEAQLAAGHTESARASLEHALTSLDAACGWSGAVTHDLLGAVYLSLGEQTAALEHNCRALALFRQMGNSAAALNIITRLFRTPTHEEAVMALSYPHTFTIDDKGQVLHFEDDLRITIRPNTVSAPVTLTLARIAGAPIGTKNHITETYTLDVVSGTLPPTLNKQLLAHVPTRVQVALGTVFTFWTNPHEVPQPDQWVPRPDQGEVVTPKSVFLMTDTLGTFQFTES